ncbi:MAG: ABC transporter permease [Chloroflexi bacterium]|nr:ABC transporter permease [Chloroflexota bacterium]
MPNEPLIRWSWVTNHLGDIAAALGQHVELTLIAIVVGLVIAVTLALVAHRYRWAEAPITWITGVIYTIPSLALFVLLIPVTGLSTTTSEVGLIGYTLLILIRNILAGLDGVPADVLEAADAMGLTRLQRLVRVEIPIALPVIVAGIRIATVTTIGLVTVTALIGQGGLGQLMLSGFISLFPTEIYVGAILSIALAVAADAGLLLAQRALTPWARTRSRA